MADGAGHDSSTQQLEEEAEGRYRGGSSVCLLCSGLLSTGRARPRQPARLTLETGLEFCPLPLASLEGTSPNRKLGAGADGGSRSEDPKWEEGKTLNGMSHDGDLNR